MTPTDGHQLTPPASRSDNIWNSSSQMEHPHPGHRHSQAQRQHTEGYASPADDDGSPGPLLAVPPPATGADLAERLVSQDEAQDSPPNGYDKETHDP
jgi:hypothetical protein